MEDDTRGGQDVLFIGCSESGCGNLARWHNNKSQRFCHRHKRGKVFPFLVALYAHGSWHMPGADDIKDGIVGREFIQFISGEAQFQHTQERAL